jgi:hypothetical protein
MGCKDYFECEFCCADVRRGDCCSERKQKQEDDQRKFAENLIKIKEASDLLIKHGVKVTRYPSQMEAISAVDVAAWMKSKGFE